jgi:hypothetical protein
MCCQCGQLRPDPDGIGVKINFLDFPFFLWSPIFIIEERLINHVPIYQWIIFNWQKFAFTLPTS